MVPKFEKAMAKMATLGQNPRKLIDCSEVIPVPRGRVKQPTLPAGKTIKDIEASVSSLRNVCFSVMPCSLFI